MDLKQRWSPDFRNNNKKKEGKWIKIDMELRYKIILNISIIKLEFEIRWILLNPRNQITRTDKKR